VIDIWERFIDKGKLDGTLNKNKYDLAPISVEVKTIRILNIFFHILNYNIDTRVGFVDVKLYYSLN
jgi:hypothetical protein